MMSAISAGSRIAFITEGGPDVGLGHLSRCVALARAAAADGARASFLVCEDAQVASLLRDVRAEVLRVPWQVDPARALRTLSGLAPDALLDPSYAAAPGRAVSDRVRRVLICLGGGRQADTTLTALSAVDRALEGCVVDVAAGPFSAGSGDLGADVAISGAGVTLHEL